MRIEQLETLIEVADRASMHKAAESLHTSVQNVSKQIKQLELDLGINLFNRSNAGVFLTSDGEYVYDKSREIVSLVDEVSQHFSNRSSGAAASSHEIARCAILAAHFSQSIASRLLGALVDKFVMGSSSIITEDAATINKQLINSPNDVFNAYEFVFTHYIQEEFSLLEPIFKQYESYRLEKFGLAAHFSCENPLAERSSISIRDVSDQPLVFAKTDSSTHVEMALQSYGITLRPKYRFNSTASADYYIEHNMGYGLRPYTKGSPADATPPGTVLVPLKERVVFNQVVIFGAQTANQALASTALAYFRKNHPGLTRLS